MFSISPAEILTIAVVALLVFGPKRLPEIARKAGKIIRDIRDTANDLKSGLEAEYETTLEPLKDIRDSMQEAIAGVEGQVAGSARTPSPSAGTGIPAPDSEDAPDASPEDIGS